MNVVTTRERGNIPNCIPAEASFKAFDERKYWRGVEAYCKEIQDYIEHMRKVRLGLVTSIN